MMSLAAAYGEITPMPAAAIFADTQNEPGSVYRWLDWLEQQLPFPVYRVTKGNLAEDTCASERKDGKGSGVRAESPLTKHRASVDNNLGSARSLQSPADSTLCASPAPRPRAKQPPLIGISLDEVHRMKPSRVKYYDHIWPLIDRRISRQDCLKWMAAHGYPTPPRSACVFCPYRSDREWLQLKNEAPEEFQKAIEFERAYQAAKASTVSPDYIPYLHTDRKPLDQVRFDGDQPATWGNECEGMCGV
jgi:hypothetical protein